MNSSASTFVQTEEAAILDRRSVLRMAAGLGAAAIAGGAFARIGAPQEASASSGGYYRTTVALNLRTGPSTNRRILLVIPANGLVTDLGGNQNGFRQVEYKGIQGWASLAYLVVSDGGSNPPPVMSGTAITTNSVNLRSGPSTGHKVVRVLAKDTRVHTSTRVENGFRYVMAGGDLGGWIYDSLLRVDGLMPSEGTAVTTSALNLRAEPSLSAKVLVVMPSGSSVDLTGNGSGQFAQVVYKGKMGWAATAYLN